MPTETLRRTHHVLRARSTAWIAVALRFAAAILTLLPFAAGAVDFMVNSVEDGHDALPGDGICSTGVFIALPSVPPIFQAECTLRAAMEEANALAESDRVTFSEYLPVVGGEILIEPATPLPMIRDALVFDGYTAPGYQSANPEAPPVVHLSGRRIAGTGHGLWVGPGGDYTLIRGLAIFDFPGNGIRVSPFFAPGPWYVSLEGSHIGVRRSFFYDQGNASHGIEVINAGPGANRTPLLRDLLRLPRQPDLGQRRRRDPHPERRGHDPRQPRRDRREWPRHERALRRLHAECRLGHPRLRRKRRRDWHPPRGVRQPRLGQHGGQRTARERRGRSSARIGSARMQWGPPCSRTGSMGFARTAPAT